jgi:hypothetical protein
VVPIDQFLNFSVFYPFATIGRKRQVCPVPQASGMFLWQQKHKLAPYYRKEYPDIVYRDLVYRKWF